MPSGIAISLQAFDYFDHHEYGMFKMNEELKKSCASDLYSLEMGSVRDREKVRAVIEKVQAGCGVPRSSI